MKILKRFAFATVSTAALSLAMMSPSFAAPADPGGPESSSISSCTDSTPFTCNIYETNANGAPSEDTGLIPLPATVSTGWIVLLETGTDQSTTNWSDIIQFSNSEITGQVEMWSDPETGFDPALLALVTNPFFITEDPSGVTSYFSGGTQGVNNDYFFHSDADVTTPEPLTLSIFGAGLAGAAALRRRKRKLA